MIFHGSPHPGGATDQLAGYFGSGAESAGANARHIFLRDYVIYPCTGCGACASPPFSCAYASMDQTGQLYRQLLASDMAVFASPIYFYALPAHFKAFIDRCQSCWQKWQAGVSGHVRKIPALAILAAGRKTGDELFTGALRTLHWHGKPLGLEYGEPLLYRGIDTPGDASKDSGVKEELFRAGLECAQLYQTAG